MEVEGEISLTEGGHLGETAVAAENDPKVVKRRERSRGRFRRKRHSKAQSVPDLDTQLSTDGTDPFVDSKLAGTEDKYHSMPRKSRSRSGSKSRFSGLFKRKSRSSSGIRSRSETDVSKDTPVGDTRTHASARDLHQITPDVPKLQGIIKNKTNNASHSAGDLNKVTVYSDDFISHLRYSPTKQPRSRLKRMTVRDAIEEKRSMHSTIQSLKLLSDNVLSSSLPDVSNVDNVDDNVINFPDGDEIDSIPNQKSFTLPRSKKNKIHKPLASNENQFEDRTLLIHCDVNGNGGYSPSDGPSIPSRVEIISNDTDTKNHDNNCDSDNNSDIFFECTDDLPETVKADQPEDKKPDLPPETKEEEKPADIVLAYKSPNNGVQKQRDQSRSRFLELSRKMSVLPATTVGRKDSVIAVTYLNRKESMACSRDASPNARLADTFRSDKQIDASKCDKVETELSDSSRSGRDTTDKPRPSTSRSATISTLPRLPVRKPDNLVYEKQNKQPDTSSSKSEITITNPQLQSINTVHIQTTDTPVAFSLIYQPVLNSYKAGSDIKIVGIKSADADDNETQSSDNVATNNTETLQYQTVTKLDIDENVEISKNTDENCSRGDKKGWFKKSKKEKEMAKKEKKEQKKEEKREQKKEQKKEKDNQIINEDKEEKQTKKEKIKKSKKSKQNVSDDKVLAAEEVNDKPTETNSKEKTAKSKEKKGKRFFLKSKSKKKQTVADHVYEEQTVGEAPDEHDISEKHQGISTVLEEKADIFYEAQEDVSDEQPGSTKDEPVLLESLQNATQKCNELATDLEYDATKLAADTDLLTLKVKKSNFPLVTDQTALDFRVCDSKLALELTELKLKSDNTINDDSVTEDSSERQPSLTVPKRAERSLSDGEVQPRNEPPRILKRSSSSNGVLPLPADEGKFEHKTMPQMGTSIQQRYRRMYNPVKTSKEQLKLPEGITILDPNNAPSLESSISGNQSEMGQSKSSSPDEGIELPGEDDEEVSVDSGVLSREVSKKDKDMPRRRGIHTNRSFRSNREKSTEKNIAGEDQTESTKQLTEISTQTNEDDIKTAYKLYLKEKKRKKKEERDNAKKKETFVSVIEPEKESEHLQQQEASEAAALHIKTALPLPEIKVNDEDPLAVSSVVNQSEIPLSEIPNDPPNSEDNLAADESQLDVHDEDTEKSSKKKSKKEKKREKKRERKREKEKKKSGSFFRRRSSKKIKKNDQEKETEDEVKEDESLEPRVPDIDDETFVFIENEINLSKLAEIKETDILDDDIVEPDINIELPRKHLRFETINLQPIQGEEPLPPFSKSGRLSRRRDSTIREKRKKCLNAFKRFIAFLFSHIGLCSLVVAYTIMGGFVFKAIEGPHESMVKNEIRSERTKLIDKLIQHAFELKMSKAGRSNFSHAVDLDLKSFQTKIHTATTANGWDGNDETEFSDQQWSFASALLYAITVMTTIGYGHVAPKTDLGRIVTIGYAVLGIPLTLLCLTNIGDVMATGFRLLYGKVCCGVCCKLFRPRRRRMKLPDPEKGISRVIDEEDQESDKPKEVIQVPTSLCILLIAGYIFSGALLFSLWEQWDYLTGSYFCFITLSTIGFGDIVPGTELQAWAGEEKLVLCAMYLVFGLSLIAMCFNLVQEDVKAKCRWLGMKIGIIDKPETGV